jgi:pimeloyl-ACP methyl ester carboxylesterase
MAQRHQFIPSRQSGIINNRKNTMKRYWLRLTLMLTVAGASQPGVSGQQPAAAAPQSDHRPSFLKPCQIPNVKGEALCGQYKVYENRESRKGRKIALNIQILPALSAPAAPDPLFFLAGGPGGGATAYGPFSADTFAAVRKERDIVLVDQRGTGDSNPLLCDLYGKTLQGYLGDLIPIAAISACRPEWEKHADLRHYTTPNAMADLDQVRAALGYERINIFGTSYGTRAAQAYLRQYPQHVRTIILKGSTPITESFVPSIARDAQRALELVFEDCEKDEACHKAFPNLKQEFKAVLDRLEVGAVKVGISDPETGRTEEVELSRGAFGTTLRSLLQSAYAAAQVPMLIHQAFENDFAPYVRQVRTLRTNSPVGSGAFLTIINSEDLPLTNPQRVKRASAGTFLEDYYYRQLLRACEGLPRGRLPRNYRSPVRSSAPVLFISGFRDPATPPRNAYKIARYLSNSLHVVVRYGGHAYGGFAPCVDSIMAAFIAAGTLKGLDTSCVSQLQQIKFHIPSAKTANTSSGYWPDR